MEGAILIEAMLWLLGVLITLVILQSVFKINSRQKQLDAQTRLLGHIAEKLGVDQTTVNKIVKERK